MPVAESRKRIDPWTRSRACSRWAHPPREPAARAAAAVELVRRARPQAALLPHPTRTGGRAPPHPQARSRRVPRPPALDDALGITGATAVEKVPVLRRRHEGAATVSRWVQNTSCAGSACGARTGSRARRLRAHRPCSLRVFEVGSQKVCDSRLVLGHRGDLDQKLRAPLARAHARRGKGRVG